ncbi:YlcI/YnfO family protein [Roseburia sp. 499]|uniref:YlcI/YnfO family protein n=1 Tax=Roseburia sp. 499 TaxID=1261634 RepID=UPI00178CBF84|nr:YlcI/YnfO family protein [Roseburia sp. 499]WVK69713.1 YlcI/YnfO family protein [Roseburia sp. 499]
MAFQIKSDKKETENKTIRFPLPLVERINDVIQENDVTFSGFVIQACEYALENLETTEN